MKLLKNLKHIFLYGFILAILVFTLKWLQWKFLIIDHAMELYTGLLAVFFTGLGIWVAMELTRPKTKILTVEKKVWMGQPQELTIDHTALQRLDLTHREYEILQLLATGLSNTAIAEKLFLSLSTVKTHVSNIYVKMDVKSRTQAVAKSKILKIIP